MSSAVLLTPLSYHPSFSLAHTWSHGRNQAHNHTLEPTSVVGISPMEELAEVQAGARLNPFSAAAPLTDSDYAPSVH